MNRKRFMFSVDNPAFIFSASLLAIALILAGLVMITGNKKSAADIQDQVYEAGVISNSTPPVTPIVTSEADKGETEMPTEEPTADARSSGAVRVSFTVVSSEQPSVEQE
jgi:hypothetical protein